MATSTIRTKPCRSTRPAPPVQQHSFGLRRWDERAQCWLYHCMHWTKRKGHHDVWRTSDDNAYTTTSLLSAQFSAQAWAHKLPGEIVEVVMFTPPLAVWQSYHHYRPLELGEYPPGVLMEAA